MHLTHDGLHLFVQLVQLSHQALVLVHFSLQQMIVHLDEGIVDIKELVPGGEECPKIFLTKRVLWVDM